MNVLSLRQPSFIETAKSLDHGNDQDTATRAAGASYAPEHPVPTDGIDSDSSTLRGRLLRLPTLDPRLAGGQDGVDFSASNPHARVFDGLDAATTEIPQTDPPAGEDPEVLYNAILVETLKNIAWNIILEPVVKAVTTVGNNMVQGAYDPTRTPPPAGTKQPTQGANGNNGAGGAGGASGSNAGAGGASGAGGAGGAAK